jgi:2,4-dienoyl-CoA reductase-like NADH-dependent reductase (Old Yellow Enzyme family)
MRFAVEVVRAVRERAGATLLSSSACRCSTWWKAAAR